MEDENNYCVIYDEPKPVSVLGIWTKLAASYDLVLGYSLFGDLFLMDSATERTAVLYLMPPELVEMQFYGYESRIEDIDAPLFN